MSSKSVKESTHYLRDKTEFDISNLSLRALISEEEPFFEMSNSVLSLR